MRRLLDRWAEGALGRGLIGCDPHAWAYLRHVWSGQIPHRLTLQAFSAGALARWFRGPLRERVREAVLGPVLADSGMFDRRRLERIVDDHQSGLSDHSAPLWSLLMLESFLRRIDPGANAVR